MLGYGLIVTIKLGEFILIWRRPMDALELQSHSAASLRKRFSLRNSKPLPVVRFAVSFMAKIQNENIVFIKGWNQLLTRSPAGLLNDER